MPIKIRSIYLHSLTRSLTHSLSFSSEVVSATEKRRLQEQRALLMPLELLAFFRHKERAQSGGLIHEEKPLLKALQKVPAVVESLVMAEEEKEEHHQQPQTYDQLKTQLHTLQAQVLEKLEERFFGGGGMKSSVVLTSERALLREALGRG